MGNGKPVPAQSRRRRLPLHRADSCYMRVRWQRRGRRTGRRTRGSRKATIARTRATPCKARKAKGASRRLCYASRRSHPRLPYSTVAHRQDERRVAAPSHTARGWPTSSMMRSTRVAYWGRATAKAYLVGVLCFGGVAVHVPVGGGANKAAHEDRDGVEGSGLKLGSSFIGRPACASPLLLLRECVWLMM